MNRPILHVQHVCLASEASLLLLSVKTAWRMLLEEKEKEEELWRGPYRERAGGAWLASCSQAWVGEKRGAVRGNRLPSLFPLLHRKARDRQGERERRGCSEGGVSGGLKQQTI